MSGTTISGETFESYTDKIDVTRMSRPDTSWHFVDAAGHEHRWYHNGEPAKAYDPMHRHDLPTLERVLDPPMIDEEDLDTDDYQRSHLECRICREHIRPGYTSDAYRTYIAGLTRYSINGASVSHEEFKARAEAAMKRAGISLPGDEAGHG